MTSYLNRFQTIDFFNGQIFASALPDLLGNTIQLTGQRTGSPFPGNKTERTLHGLTRDKVLLLNDPVMRLWIDNDQAGPLVRELNYQGMGVMLSEDVDDEDCNWAPLATANKNMDKSVLLQALKDANIGSLRAVIVGQNDPTFWLFDYLDAEEGVVVDITSEFLVNPFTIPLFKHNMTARYHTWPMFNLLGEGYGTVSSRKAYHAGGDDDFVVEYFNIYPKYVWQRKSLGNMHPPKMNDQRPPAIESLRNHQRKELEALDKLELINPTPWARAEFRTFTNSQDYLEKAIEAMYVTNLAQLSACTNDEYGDLVHKGLSWQDVKTNVICYVEAARKGLIVAGANEAKAKWGMYARLLDLKNAGG